MYINIGVHLCNAILVSEIICCRYLTINNSAKITFLTKLGGHFSNLLEIKCTKYSDSFKFDISVARCLGGLLFSGHSVNAVAATTKFRLIVRLF